MKRQKLRYFESKMVSMHRHRKRMRILREWRVLVVVDRESVAFLRLKYLKFWRQNARKRKINALKCKALREWIWNRTLNRLWFQWYLETLNRIEINDKMEIAEQFYHQNLRSMQFRSWKELVVDNRRQKKLRKMALRFHCGKVKRRTFGHWYHVFVDSEQQREYDEIAQQFQVN